MINSKIYAIVGTMDEGGHVSIVEGYDTGFAGEGEEEKGIEVKGKLVTSWEKIKKR